LALFNSCFQFLKLLEIVDFVSIFSLCKLLKFQKVQLFIYAKILNIGINGNIYAC